MASLVRPNVLILYTDQQRTDTLSCYGQEALSTPNIDLLAQSGVRFTHYFVQNPVCAPSRASFLTGRYCSALRIGSNGISFPKEEFPLSKLLKPYGYETAQIGKLHFDPHARREHRNPTDTYGFDTFILSDEPGCYDDAYSKWVEAVCPEQLSLTRASLPPAAVLWGKRSYSSVPRETCEPYVFAGDAGLTHTAFVTDQMCQFLRHRSAGQPFFAIAGYYAPHPPLNPPQEYLNRVDRARLRLPIIGPEETVSSLLRDISREKWLDIAAAYLAMAAQIDDGVGEIVQTLKETGQYENTIIVYTSDHGEFLGDHGRIQKGMPGHDCIINVPCIISYPAGFAGNRVTSALAEAVDVMPTLLDFCGVQTPSFVQGRSLAGLLRGQTDTHRTSVLTEYFDANQERQTTLRTMEYKYYLHENGTQLLFDLKNDPHELHSVHQDAAYRDILADMRFQMLCSIQKAAYCSLEKTDEY